MSAPEWDTIALLLENGWPGDFDDAAQGAYRALLAGYDPEQILIGLRVLVRRGGTFRPSVSEIAAVIDGDPGRPTWSEAYRLLFGTRGLLSIRPERRAIERADERHPLLAAFIRMEGYDRLKMLPVSGEDRGEFVRRDLERSWNSLCERADQRRASGMALDEVARPRQIGPRRPDYLRGLTSGEAA